MKSTVNILYGSQNGTAKSVAESLEKELIIEKLETKLLILNDYKKIQFNNDDIIIIIISTTGDGESPDNSINFYNDINSKNKNWKILEDKKYCVLGLGDSNFNFFCRPAKTINEKFKEYKAKQICEAAYADDSNGIEVVVDPWIEKVKKIILQINEKNETELSNSKNYVEVISSPNSEGEINDEINNTLTENELQFKPVEITFDKELLSKTSQLKNVTKLPVSYLNIVKIPTLIRSIESSKEKSIFPFLSKKDCTYSENNPYPAKVLSAQCLTSNDALKKTIQVTIDISNLNWDYQPGYAFGIIAPNSDSLVIPLLKRLGLKMEECFKVLSPNLKLCSSLPISLNKEYSYYEVFKYFLNINSLPKKAFLRMLAEYTTDSEEKKQLYFLCSLQGNASYRNLRSQCPSLLDILYTFKTCNPPFISILENCGRLTPRYYSISSSPLDNPKAISFLFNIHEYEMPNSEGEKTKNIRKGLCTGWLDELLECPAIPDCIINLRPKSICLPIFPRLVNTFVLPPNPLENPIIMIGPGTGVSPFISFIEYRKHLIEEIILNDNINKEEKEKLVNDNENIWWLLYGCREFKKDFLIKDYKNSWEKSIVNKKMGITKKILDIMSISYSREGNGPKYVQHMIQQPENSERMYNLLKNKKTYIYICGDAIHMCKDIHETFISILQKHEGISYMEAQQYLTNLMKEKRYLRDVWG